jgi:hypothetical protein
MKLLLGTLIAAVLIAPLAFSGQQAPATSPAQLAKCEEGCDCEKCKKKDDTELLAGKCKKGCDCEKCEKKDDTELLAGKCKKDCDCEKCEKKKEDKSDDARLLAA